MPVFEYECRDCGAKFEQIVFNREKEVGCKSCGSTRLVQLLSLFSVSGEAAKGISEPGPCGACGSAVRGSCGMN